MTRNRRTLRRVASVVFVTAAFGFLAAYAGRNWDQLRGADWELRPPLLLLSVAVLVVAFLVGVAAWRLVLRRLGMPVRFLPLSRVWFLSALGRYIPGKVWQFVGAAHWGTSAGIAPLLSVTSLAVHAGTNLVAAVMLSALLLPAAMWPGEPGLRVASQILAVFGLLLVHPRAISSGLALVQRVTKRPMAAWSGSWTDGLALLGLETLSWLVYGTGFYLFVAGLLPLPWSAIPALTAMNALSFVAGYAVIVAPAGLGAKEGALTALLSLLMPAGAAALVAVAARLWTVVGEVLPALYFLARRTPAAPPADAPR